MDWASRATVEQAAVGWTEGQVFCRTYGHGWQPHTAYRYHGGVVEVVQRCPRCRNQRSQTINEQGYPTSGWRLRYIEGYLLSGQGRVGTDGKAALRLVTLRNLDITEVADEM